LQKHGGISTVWNSILNAIDKEIIDVGDFGIFGLFLLVVLVLRLRRMINNSGARKLYTDLSYTMFFAALVMSAISFHMYIILISAVLAVYAKNNYTRQV